MINAFLVFNNTGQPRLTRFYTQIVSLNAIRILQLQSQANTPVFKLGHTNKTIPHRTNLRFSLPTPTLRLQLPTSPSPARARCPVEHNPWPIRRPYPNHLPDICHALIYYDLDIDRVAACADRPDPGLRRDARPRLRECLRIGPDLRVRNNACCLG